MDPHPNQVVANAVEAARVAAIAALEARCTTITAKKEASAAVQFTDIAVDKVEAVNTTPKSYTSYSFLTSYNFYKKP
jgi:hypothetical protein